MTTSPDFGGEYLDPVSLLSWLDYVAIKESTATAKNAIEISQSTNKWVLLKSIISYATFTLFSMTPNFLIG